MNKYEVTMQDGSKFIVNAGTGTPQRIYDVQTHTNILNFGGYPSVAEFRADEVKAVILISTELK